MPYVQRFCFLFFAMSLAACASAPRDQQARSLKVPPPSAKVVSLHAHQSLEVCPGMRVSNAPSADGNRRVVNYEPYSRVQGVTLARAPVDACLSSGFGPRNGGASSYHRGVDLYTRNPAPIYAGGDGVVEYIGSMRGYGYTVVIRHSETVKTRYAHLSSYAPGLRTGQRVREGDLIGRTGSSGNATAVHLHYEVLVNGAAQNPLTIGS